MGTSALQVLQQFEQRMPLLEKWEEYFETRSYVVSVDAQEQADELRIPRCLRHSNTEIGEIFKPNWSDPKALSVVVARLEELCTYWENIYAAHAAARELFSRAFHRQGEYCLYLRSFSSVALNILDEPFGSAVAYVRTEALDRNLAMALAESQDSLSPVTCQHPDDLALLEGKWRIPAFRVHDHTWQTVVKKAISGAKCIVLYLDDDSPGTSIELDMLRAQKLEARTVLVLSPRARPPKDADSFAAAIPVTDFLSLSKDLMTARLRPLVRGRLEGLMRDNFQPKPIDEQLLSIPCNVVDPKAPAELTQGYDPFQTFWITRSNLTAFGWFVSGLPDALSQWNAISRQLFDKKRAPTIAALNELLGSLFRGAIGAASLGLTSTLGGLIGLRANVSQLVVVPDSAQSKARNKDLLRVLEIANRFDGLTDRHDWRKHNDSWREGILEGRYYRH